MVLMGKDKLAAGNREKIKPQQVFQLQTIKGKARL
jgi:hypothetical protein